METVRIRLVLDHILSKSQKSDGLKRCWILLKSHHRTIADLATYLLHIFDLHNACPHGLLLSMDGFVLPPFESTCILKDKGVLRVKKKAGDASFELIEVGNELNTLDVVEIVDNPPEPTAMNMLANEEFEKEARGYESEPEEDAAEQAEEALDVENTAELKTVSKKRKASKELHSSKRRKKNKSEKYAVVTENGGNSVQVEQKETLSSVLVDERSNKSSQTVLNANRLCQLEQELECGTPYRPEYRTMRVGLFAAYRHCLSRSSDSIRSCQLQENGNKSVRASLTPSGTKKVPSRSARRKKVQRQLLRERRKAEKKAQLQMELVEKIDQQSSAKDTRNVSEESSEKLVKKIDQQLSEKDTHNVSEESSEKLVKKIDQQLSEKDTQDVSKESSEKGNVKLPENMPIKDSTKPQEDQQRDQGSDVEDVVVPIVIRPGHIRFEPLKKVAAGADQALQQNQILVETYQWKGITSKKKGQKWGKEKSASCKRNYYSNFNEEVPETLDIEEETPVHDPIDFDKLPFYASLPKEGDVIAYRLIELSSSWTPELSCYRVGKISQYDLESNRIMLLPLAEYPVIPEKKTDGEASVALSDTSPYGQDGSLEISFSSLIEVRLVDNHNLISAKSGNGVDEVHVRDQDAGISSRPENKNEANAVVQENGEVNPWKEINQALNEKKGQLSQEDNWNNAERSGRKQWPYKALRGNALGPTMALLRAENGL